MRVVMSKALLISVTRDRHDVPVWDSCIRPQSSGCRPNAMVGVELRQGCCFADVFHHVIERVRSDWTRFIPGVVVETPVLSWILSSSTKEEDDVEPHVTEKREWAAQGENLRGF